MIARIRQVFAAPVFDDDEDKTRIAGLLNTILWALLATVVVYAVFSVVVTADLGPIRAVVGALAGLALGLLVLTHRGYIRLASTILLGALWLIITVGTFAFGGVRGPGPTGYLVVVPMAGLLLGGGSGLIFTGLALIGGLGVLHAEALGGLPPSPIPITPAYMWTVVGACIIMVAVLLQLYTTSIEDALDRARRGERVAAATNHDLQCEISERKRAEAALREERASLARRVAERTAALSAANAQLTCALRTKDEFLATMSHELRTPLNAILGLAEALQEGVYGPLTERQLERLRSVEKSGRHLLALIDDVLDVAEIGTGTLDLDLRPVVVEAVCQASLESIRDVSRKKRLKIVSTFDSAVEAVEADERRLKQILVNLLNNSVKFTPEGGMVGLEVVGDVEGQAVHFTVWDTGVGILEEDVAKLFQPFVQLDTGLARRYGGTGLGLALVYSLAEMHGGGVAVESEVGQGSRFTVSLPWRGGGQEGGRQGDKGTGRRSNEGWSAERML